MWRYCIALLACTQSKYTFRKRTLISQGLKWRSVIIGYGIRTQQQDINSMLNSTQYSRTSRCGMWPAGQVTCSSCPGACGCRPKSHRWPAGRLENAMELTRIQHTAHTYEQIRLLPSRKDMKNTCSQKWLPPLLSTMMPAAMVTTASPRFCTDWQLQRERLRIEQLEQINDLTSHMQCPVDIRAQSMKPGATDWLPTWNRTVPLCSSRCTDPNGWRSAGSELAAWRWWHRTPRSHSFRPCQSQIQTVAML